MKIAQQLQPYNKFMNVNIDCHLPNVIAINIEVIITQVLQTGIKANQVLFIFGSSSLL